MGFFQVTISVQLVKVPNLQDTTKGNETLTQLFYQHMTEVEFKQPYFSLNAQTFIFDK